MEDDHFKTLRREFKSSWICSGCSNLPSRNKNKNKGNMNTLVKQHQVPTSDVSMNMSFDMQDNSDAKVLATPSCSEPTGQCRCSGGVTMDKISTLLDQKLNASLSIFMKDFHALLKKEVGGMVRSEMSCVVQEFKTDLNNATEFFSSEQETLKTRIAEKDATIKVLETDCEHLQSEMYNLTNRMSAIEKTTRSYNIEIQAVPESRNENVTSLFKKLCNIVNFPLEDGGIHACRRIAKMDNTSKRPRNILVTLASPRMKDSILSAVQRFNKAHPRDTLNSRQLEISGETHKIYVVEHLSPQCKQLHAAARRFAREKQYKYVWAKYGRVYLRKDDNSGSIFVKNLETLDKLS